MLVDEILGDGVDLLVELQQLPSIWPGSDLSSASRWRASVSRRRAELERLADGRHQHQHRVSCVVNALVEATPISGPARVISTRLDSRTSDDSGTLQILRLPT